MRRRGSGGKDRAEEVRGEVVLGSRRRRKRRGVSHLLFLLLCLPSFLTPTGLLEGSNLGEAMKGRVEKQREEGILMFRLNDHSVSTPSFSLKFV